MKGLIIGIIIVGLLLGAFGIVWGQRSELVKLDEKIKAQHTANKSDYDNMWKKFKEMTQVTDIQAEQFKDVYTGLIQGRYQDSSLLFKMVQEQNPQLDTSVYSNIQREIAAGRNQFNNNQAKLVDVIREYNSAVRDRCILGAMIFNFKEKDPNQYVVTSERTTKAFDSGKDEVIDLRTTKPKKEE